MDKNQLLQILASRPPAERIQICVQLNIPPALLHQLEQEAVAKGLPLVGGFASEGAGGSGAADSSAELSISLEKVRGWRRACPTWPGSPPTSGCAQMTSLLSLSSPLPHCALFLPPTLNVQLWEITCAKIWGYGGLAVFFLALPFGLHLMKERRGLSWAGLLAQAARLPFSD